VSYKYERIANTRTRNTYSKKVESGRYTSASEVVREALRLLEEQDALRELRRDGLRKEIMKGVEG
jgi:antitoxin ParD1/3/4